MKSFACTVCLSFCLLAPVLSAQNTGAANLANLLIEVNDYHQKYLLPVYQQQRLKFNQYLDKNEIAQLYHLSVDYHRFANDKKALLNNASINASEFMKTWENLQQEEVRILVSVEGLTDKYFFVLQKLLKDDLKTQILQWQKDINLLTGKYNTNINYPKERLFAKYGFGQWSDPLYFVLWQAQKPNTQEAAADTGRYRP